MVMIELSIFDFLSNFTCPDLQLFSVLELPQSMLVITAPNQTKIDQELMKTVMFFNIHGAC